MLHDSRAAAASTRSSPVSRKGFGSVIKWENLLGWVAERAEVGKASQNKINKFALDFGMEIYLSSATFRSIVPLPSTHDGEDLFSSICNLKEPN